MEVRTSDTGIVREIRLVDLGSRLGQEYGIEILGAEECSKCALTEACNGVGSLVWARSLTVLQVGQPVILDLNPSTALKATGLVYGVPLVTLIAGILAGYFWLFASADENIRAVLSTALGFGSMILGGWISSRRDRKVAAKLTMVARPNRLLDV